jgi:hypothetical protein
MTIQPAVRFACRLVIGLLCLVWAAMAQTETATVSGLITDSTGAVVSGAGVKLQSVDRGTTTSGTTNNAGIYVFASVYPGPYQIIVQKPGFKQVDFLGLIVNVQDHIEQNFRLQVGSVSESITVTGNELNVNTSDATVSTVVDRQFAENLPMNGRSFQTLIDLTPGVVVVPGNASGNGQFVVNGQRAASNYWMVDGVGANIGLTPTATPGNSLGGSIGAFNAQGGTNGLVSVDALQEFRIQTSTYAPEFGRTPGGQISIVTRSGANRFHGAAFDYFRNDVLDANDWFADQHNLPKPEERQNDFGGTFSGPILKDHTFFFFSYEGLRLRLPRVAQTDVPTVSARQNAIVAVQPYLNAFPLPNGPSSGTDQAEYNASFSNQSTLDAYSLRVDQKLTDRVTLFGRYNYSPSNSLARALQNGFPVSNVEKTSITIQTATVGATWIITPEINDDFRFNYSRLAGSSSFYLDNYGGAIPPAPSAIQSSNLIPSPFSLQNSQFLFDISTLRGGQLLAGNNQQNTQQQINLVDNLSVQRGSHSLKFGVDFRRLSPLLGPQLYAQDQFFQDVPSVEAGNISFTLIFASKSARMLFHNLGIFAQDTWRVGPRLTLTYGLRWDVDFAPSTTNGPSLLAVTGFSKTNFSNLALAPPGTPPFKTSYNSVAPRIGVAYQLSRGQDWQSVLRGGFGVFYDLATSEVGNFISPFSYPFGATSFTFGGTFPFSSQAASPPPITVASLSSGVLFASDPNLKEPYTLQWNLALEQALGQSQAITVSYIGSVGRRLLASEAIIAPNPNFGEALVLGNAGSSDYNALQVQFQRRLSRGLQALISYTWSHSIDTGSFGAYVNGPLDNLTSNRGSSDFDIRHAFSAGLTYDVPTPKTNPFINAVLHGWSVQSIIQARSAPPVDVFYSPSTFSELLGENAPRMIRPDLIPGIPLYLYGPQYPGGKAINSTPDAVAGGCPGGSQSIGPFCPPPIDPTTQLPTRQGNLGRNSLRGFGLTQWDFAVHRDFPIRESLKLQFRAEMFNVLNHPNFGPPSGCLGLFCFPSNPFGVANQMLGQSLNNGLGSFSPEYQVGGPRSIQFALKLLF